MYSTFLGPALLIFVLSALMRAKASRERDLRQRLKRDGERCDALILDARVLAGAIVPGISMLGLGLSFTSAQGRHLDATVMSSYRPQAYSLKGQTAEAMYLLSDPKQVRLVSDLDSDDYPKQLLTASRRGFITAGVMIIVGLAQIAMAIVR